MTLIQFAIGALNDLVDAPVDRIGKPGKPIPAGLVAPVVARATVVVAAAGGGPVPGAARRPGAPAHRGARARDRGLVRPAGQGHDALVAAVRPRDPLLPVFGWYGAVGSLPAVFFVLIPAAANAGTSLAVANAIVDMERDDAAGIESIALASARGASWLGGRAAGRGRRSSRSGRRRCRGADRLGAGRPVRRLRAARRRDPRARRPSAAGGTSWREVAWEIQPAVGSGLLAVAWLAALSASAG